MADNTQLNPVSSPGGDVLRTDYNAAQSAKTPVTKIELGSDGSFDGFVADTEPLPVGGNTVKDGSGTKYCLVVDSDGHLQVDVLGSVTISDGGGSITIDGTVSIGALTPGTDGVLVWGNTAKDGSGTDLVPLLDADGHLQIDVLSTALPTGAATAANQATGNGHLSTLAGAISSGKYQVDVVSDLPLSSSTDSVAAVQSGTWSVESVQSGAWSVAQSGAWSVTIGSALPAGSNTIGRIEPSGTALSNGQVSCNTTVGGTTIRSASAGQQGVLLKNIGSETVYIGTGTVTTSNGFPLEPGESVSVPADNEIKGITASSSTTVAYIQLA